MTTLLFIVFITLGYLSGSVCSAIIVSRLFSLPDPRTTGSNNPGATNVLRLAGKKYAVIVLVFDILKGFFPVLLANLLGADLITLGFTCFSAVMGHIFPIFFKFKGGKGVATALGALVGLNLHLGILCIALWFLVATFTRYSSLASIISLTLAPFFALLIFKKIDILPPLCLITLFILYKHRNNITRLFDKEEPKIGSKHNTLHKEVEAVLEQEKENKD